MVRAQIQLTDEQSVLLKQVAERRHLSVDEVIGQGIDHFLRHYVAVGREERARRAIEAAGRFASGKSDVSARHDAHLAEAYEQ